ncbi:hypothetical protein D9M70_437650 [compost metagenome]
MRHEDMAAVQVLLQRAVVLQHRVGLARAYPQVQRRHHFLDDFRVPGRERGECQVQLIGAHRGHVGLPGMGLDQLDMQVRRQLLDAQHEAVEHRVTQLGGKADAQRAGGHRGIEIVGVAFVDRRPQVQHVADLGAQLQRAGSGRQAVGDADEERIVKDLAQPAQRMGHGGRGHMHLLRDVSGVSLAQQLGEDH